MEQFKDYLYESSIMLKNSHILVILLGISVTAVFGATTFYADGAFTVNGVQWCEEELPLYKLLGETKWHEHHNYSIEARICAQLINDPLWDYHGSERIEKLIEQSRYYSGLAIGESQKEKVPNWIKNNARWWSQKQIGDSDFVNGIKYLIENKIISVSPINVNSQSTQESVPAWIRTNAEWWSNGLISEDEFLSGIEYLIKVRIIKISSSNTDSRTESTPELTQILISLNTSRNSYQEGDIILISGKVSSIILDTPVTVQIFHEGNLVDIVQMTVTQDGKFTHTFHAQGPTWHKNGKYIVRASYGANSMIETNFQYFTKQSITETTDIFEVNAGSSRTFDVNYTVRAATIKDMVIDRGDLKLIVYIEAENDGSITIDLPRYAIDAKKSDNTDDAFIIIIDGVEVPYKEISTNVSSRTIQIEFEKGDSDIEIIGSFVI